MSYSGAHLLRPPANNKIDDAILAALKDYHIVHLDHDNEYNEKLTWCLEHCKSKFRDFADGRSRAWYFKDEQDAVIFAMKWA